MSKAPFRLKPPPKPRLSENEIERSCLDILRLRGYLVLRQQSGLFKTPDGRWIRLGEKGIPDYAAVHRLHPGFLLEVKRPGGQLSPDQQNKIQEYRVCHRIAVAVIDSVEALSEWLNEHETKNR
jgi:hypothetical protein